MPTLDLSQKKQTTLTVDEAKALALASHLEISVKNIEQDEYKEDTFLNGEEEYLVLTDSEADEKEEEYLDSYIDDYLICTLPESCKQYFNRDEFKSDCHFDGRGNSLATYDGWENCETIDGTEYYIYRTN